MKTCRNWPISVCSWSLQTHLKGVGSAMDELGLAHVHLDLNPAIADPEAFIIAVCRQNWTITSMMIGFPQEDYSTLESIRKTGGIVPDDCWESNYRRFLRAIEVTAALQVPYLSSHFGFLDRSSSDYADKFRNRICRLADAAAEKHITLLMETGQENADELRLFLESLGHKALAVNFDPANMILYNQGDPIKAVEKLAPWIRHVHVKDAVLTETCGTWGCEVVWGQGHVGADLFLRALGGIGFNGALAVEREAGTDRLGDIKSAIQQLESFV